jgi:peptidoglycan lytic transglycosylase
MRTVALGARGAIPGPLLRLARAGRVFAAACLIASGVLGVRATPVRAEQSPGQPIVGQASWYGHEFARRRTACGDVFDPQNFTGAHRTLPLGSKVRVTNLHNGKSVLVTINDRGPYFRRRDIDLSYGAARVLGILRRGIARVRIELVESRSGVSPG